MPPPRTCWRGSSRGTPVPASGPSLVPAANRPRRAPPRSPPARPADVRAGGRATSRAPRRDPLEGRRPERGSRRSPRPPRHSSDGMHPRRRRWSGSREPLRGSGLCRRGAPSTEDPTTTSRPGPHFGGSLQAGGTLTRTPIRSGCWSRRGPGREPLPGSPQPRCCRSGRRSWSRCSSCRCRPLRGRTSR